MLTEIVDGATEQRDGDGTEGEALQRLVVSEITKCTPSKLNWHFSLRIFERPFVLLGPDDDAAVGRPRREPLAVVRKSDAVDGVLVSCSGRRSGNQ